MGRVRQTVFEGLVLAPLLLGEDRLAVAVRLGENGHGGLVLVPSVVRLGDPLVPYGLMVFGVRAGPLKVAPQVSPSPELPQSCPLCLDCLDLDGMLEVNQGAMPLAVVLVMVARVLVLDNQTVS